MSAAAALLAAAALAGCGSTTYFDGRTLPPSGLTNRVMIAIQNPSAFTKGALQIVDAYYDIRSSYNGQVPSFSISGYSGNLPVSIQNMPEERFGAVFGSGDGALAVINYATEASAGSMGTFSGAPSALTSTDQLYAFGADLTSHVLQVVDKSGTNSGTYALSLPGIYRVSVNPGGSAALAFVQNSNYVYYPRKLTAAEGVTFASGTSAWPKAAVDCEPQSLPAWCLFQAQVPTSIDATGNYYGAALTFDRPTKAVFSSDGATAYILNCGPECGGVNAGITPLPVAPIIFRTGLASGKLPAAPVTTKIPGGATNALIDSTSSTMYVVGQCQATATLSGGLPQCTPSGPLFTGMLTLVSLSTSTPTVTSQVSISDGAPGAVSRMVEGDDNTLWIAMTKCTNGPREINNLAYGCLTMFNTSTKTVTMLEPYLGDATGVTSVTGLHKIYTAEGGQVYIYSTASGATIDNQYVTVTGTAYDVAYIDAITDGDNTVY
jgi:hypothetical protein